MTTEMTLPQIGEEIESAVVLSILVEPGTEVAKGDPVLELESDKATTEVPASEAGVVKAIHVQEGEEVKAGQKILTLESGSESESEAESESESEPESESESESEPESESESESESEPESESESEPESESESEPEPEAEPEPEPESESELEPEPEAEPEPEPESDSALQSRAASPSVRRLARELGVRVEEVAATGADGRVTAEDVKSHVRHLLGKGGDRSREPEPAPALPDFAAFGEIEVVPLAPLRRVIARNVATNLAIPQVTQFDQADATDLEQFREQQSTDEAPITLTAVLLAIVTRALREFPVFNASLDLASSSLVLKHYVNLGVAVDTDAGLLVPVIHNAQSKGLLELARELDALATAARERKLKKEQLVGASFTVTNLGGLGTTRFTPLVLPPLVAVLGVGRLETVAVHRGETFEPRRMLPLCISYDHRAVDGADAARFCRCIAEMIENPLRLLFGGADGGGPGTLAPSAAGRSPKS